MIDALDPTLEADQWSTTMHCSTLSPPRHHNLPRACRCGHGHTRHSTPSLCVQRHRTVAESCTNTSPWSKNHRRATERRPRPKTSWPTPSQRTVGTPRFYLTTQSTDRSFHAPAHSPSTHMSRPKWRETSSLSIARIHLRHHHRRVEVVVDVHHRFSSP
jgi:hypothetical protein